MKTIGIIGGMSWESTTEYYRMLNTLAAEKLGGLRSAKCLIYSVDFGPLASAMAEGAWQLIESELVCAARKLEAAGADFILIATNTMHKMADEVSAAVGIPLIHIADCAADALLASGHKKVGLLGTKPTMEMDFYRDKLAARNIEVIIPQAEERFELHRIIFEELCRGIISDESRRLGLAMINRLVKNGAQGLLLGCTELALLFRPQDTPHPLFDTAEIHARSAFEKALA